MYVYISLYFVIYIDILYFLMCNLNLVTCNPTSSKLIRISFVKAQVKTCVDRRNPTRRGAWMFSKGKNSTEKRINRVVVSNALPVVVSGLTLI